MWCDVMWCDVMWCGIMSSPVECCARLSIVCWFLFSQQLHSFILLFLPYSSHLTKFSPFHLLLLFSLQLDYFLWLFYSILQAVVLRAFDDSTFAKSFSALQQVTGILDCEVLKRLLHSLSCQKYKVSRKDLYSSISYPTLPYLTLPYPTLSCLAFPLYSLCMWFLLSMVSISAVVTYAS